MASRSARFFVLLGFLLFIAGLAVSICASTPAWKATGAASWLSVLAVLLWLDTARWTRTRKVGPHGRPGQRTNLHQALAVRMHAVRSPESTMTLFEQIARTAMTCFAVIAALLLAGCFYNPKSMRTVSVMDIFPDDPCPRGAIYAYLTGRPCSNKTGSPISSSNANDIVPGTNDCPLLFATRNWNAPAIEELLAKGAQPALCVGSPSSFYKAAIRRVCESNPYPLKPVLELLERQLLIDRSLADSVLLVSARNVCVPGLQQAIRLGANPNVMSPEGYTPLHLVAGTASSRVIEATQLLVSAGADPDISGANGETAFAAAQRKLGDTGNWPRLKAALLSGKAKDGKP